jgi:hypothetical protein
LYRPDGDPLRGRNIVAPKPNIFILGKELCLTVIILIHRILPIHNGMDPNDSKHKFLDITCEQIDRDTSVSLFIVCEQTIQRRFLLHGTQKAYRPKRVNIVLVLPSFVHTHHPWSKIVWV